MSKEIKEVDNRKIGKKLNDPEYMVSLQSSL